jgi:hypothetical protein
MIVNMDPIYIYFYIDIFLTYKTVFPILTVSKSDFSSIADNGNGQDRDRSHVPLSMEINPRRPVEMEKKSSYKGS